MQTHAFHSGKSIDGSGLCSNRIVVQPFRRQATGFVGPSSRLRERLRFIPYAGGKPARHRAIFRAKSFDSMRPVDTTAMQRDRRTIYCHPQMQASSFWIGRIRPECRIRFLLAIQITDIADTTRTDRHNGCLRCAGQVSQGREVAFAGGRLALSQQPGCWERQRS